jgi:hypothetical protein
MDDDADALLRGIAPEQPKGPGIDGRLHRRRRREHLVKPELCTRVVTEFLTADPVPTMVPIRRTA